MDPETPFWYCLVNCVSIILAPPSQTRERVYVVVGPLQKLTVVSSVVPAYPENLQRTKVLDFSFLVEHRFVGEKKYIFCYIFVTLGIRNHSKPCLQERKVSLSSIYLQALENVELCHNVFLPRQFITPVPHAHHVYDDWTKLNLEPLEPQQPQ